MEKVYFEARLRLLENIKIKNGCWIWQLSCFHDGYGQSSLLGKKMRAHRLSYFLFTGVDPKELYVCHHCDNPKCINPDHMFLGTYEENMQDCRNKKRFIKGEKQGRSKLKEFQIKEIKSLLDEGVYQKDIAKLYEVTSSNISCINRKVSWRHLQ